MTTTAVTATATAPIIAIAASVALTTTLTLYVYIYICLCLCTYDICVVDIDNQLLSIPILSCREIRWNRFIVHRNYVIASKFIEFK